MALNNCSLNYIELDRVGGAVLGAENARLVISPNNGYVVSASAFTYNTGSIPGVISIVLSDSATPNTLNNVVYVDVDIDDAYIMPTYDFEITTGVSGNAIPKPLIISGTHSANLSNTTESSYTGVYYTQYGSYESTVTVFTKTFSALPGYYFEEAPVYSITSGSYSNYKITFADTLDINSRLISREFTVTYKFPSTSIYYNSIEFTALAREVYVVPTEITAYDISISSIPAIGDVRTISVFGTPGASFSFSVVDELLNVVESITSRVIGSTGKYTFTVAFPPSGINKEYTVTIGGDLSPLFDTPSGQVSSFIINQYVDINISFTASHSDGSVAFTYTGLSQSFEAKKYFSEFESGIVGSIEISSTNALTIVSQPNIGLFTNTDPLLNGGTDMLITSAVLKDSVTPGNLTLDIGSVLFLTGYLDVIANIDLSSNVIVGTPPVDSVVASSWTTITGTDNYYNTSGTITVTGATAEFYAQASSFSIANVSTSITINGITRTASASNGASVSSTSFFLPAGTYAYSVAVSINSGTGAGGIAIP